MAEGVKKADQKIWVLPWLGAIAVLAVGFPVGPSVRARLSTVQPDPTANDVAIGTPIELPSQDVHGQPIDSKARTLLVYAGTCSGCSNSGISPEMLRAARFPQVVLLMIGSERQLLELYPKPRQNVHLVADGTGSTVQALGAITAPRFYILENGKVEEVWKNLRELPREWMGEVRQ